MLAQIIFCILAADFITGLVHWAEDTYGTPAWVKPLDSLVVLPNIDHHRFPSAIGTMSNWFSRNYVTIGLFLITYLFISIIWISDWRLFLTGLLSALGNEVHTWNHRKVAENSWWVRILQDACIVQTRQQHNLHHRPPYDGYYCTLTNVVNAILEPIRFWRMAEWLLSCVGIQVKRCSAERYGF